MAKKQKTLKEKTTKETAKETSEEETTEAAVPAEEEGEQDSKVMRSVGWGVSAFQIIMKNKIMIAVCLLVQGIFYALLPQGSLEWNARLLTGLAVLYALACIIVVLTSGHKTAVKSKEVVGGWYKGMWKDKQKQLVDPREKLPENEMIQSREQKAAARDEKLRAFSQRNQQRFEKRKWLLVAGYVILIGICVPMFIYASFTVRTVHAILGVIMAIEGALTIVTVVKTKNTVHPRARIMSIVIAVFSIALGILLMFLPSDTADFIVRLVGIGFLIKGVAELVVGLCNRSLILSTKDTIARIKEL